MRYVPIGRAKKDMLFTKISNKLVSDRVSFHSLIDDRKEHDFLFRPKDHAERVVFQRCRMHMLIQKCKYLSAPLPPPPGDKTVVTW